MAPQELADTSDSSRKPRTPYSKHKYTFNLLLILVIILCFYSITTTVKQYLEPHTNFRDTNTFSHNAGGFLFSENPSVSHVFTFKNFSSKPVNFTKILKSCQCTTATSDRKQLRHTLKPSPVLCDIL